MNLIIYVNDNFEDERTLFDLDKNKLILNGDDYHDKIDERIDGYLEALVDFDIYTKDVPSEWIEEDHEHYKIAFPNSR
jgi:hypothetical protein